LKGFDFLIRSLALLPVEQRLPLVIASNFQNPPERAYLEDLARRVSVNLTLTSDIDDAALVLLYNQAFLTLYAPIREPFGFVTIESMACGTPLVAVREGGMMETVPDGQAGWLTERSEAAFADAVQRLYSQPERRAEFGDYGRKHVQAHWSWDTAVQCLEDHFLKE
jgi:glycosyltransferase involved in cell wall biosynthesis